MAQSGGGGSSIANGNSNVNIATANGNIIMSAIGNNIIAITGTGANILGYANITGNVALSGANVTLGAVANLKISGGSSTYVLSTDGASNLSWVAQSGGGGGGSSIANGNSNINIATANGNITMSAVGNSIMSITGTGVNIAGYTNLGSVSNVVMTGGTGGYILSTDGAGALSWISPGAGGGNSSIYNGSSNIRIVAANGNVTTSVNGTANVMIVSNVGVTVGTGTGGNITGGNLVTANYISGTILPRVVVITDNTSVTMNVNTTDIASQTNTQVAGTLTINAPTGTLYDGLKIIFRLKSANIQTFSWNAVFAGSTDLALPTVSSGSNKYDYTGFIYNSTSATWQILSKNYGF